MTPGRSSGRPARGSGRRTAKSTPPRAAATRKTDHTITRATGAGSDVHLARLGPFRLGAVPGATPGKWMDVWKERMPANAIELRTIEVAEQQRALTDGSVDAALVRLPVVRDGLSIISLYDETTVAVCAVDAALSAVDELTLDDLVGEIVMVPADDTLAIDVPGAVAPNFPTLATTEDAVATAATGAGIVLMPMSLARLHHRKDATYRPIVDAPTSTIALAWRTDATTPLVEAFIGIVRGRTANSSR
ncbi:LysR substrate-binding domain-containing protein [Microbacterium sp. cf332]|uniref:LysR substrate-binding domain-containing protein n=1 Tax=Microbacterium sp. cf332 TaxID=1761804 RepID=UPI00087E6855|nr:LysR substrate-binding domain-containing protein [Microbacterium sp. cf332]SDQ46414.1 DNA-binding transcriptional regulator, LysR family [Microbacterium sp. cf332]